MGHFPVAEDPDPAATYQVYRSKLGKQIDAYREFAIKQLNFMWLRDRLWFVKQLVKDLGRAEAKKRLEALIDEKAAEIGTRYKRWGEEKGITNPLLVALDGYKFDWPWIAPSWWHVYYPDEQNPTEVEWRLVCHIGEFWKEQPPEYREFGLCFCDVDVKLVRHIDPRLTLERPQTQYSVDGCKNYEYCKFVMRINAETPPDR
jgi:hypothetical protein